MCPKRPGKKNTFRGKTEGAIRVTQRSKSKVKTKSNKVGKTFFIKK